MSTVLAFDFGASSGRGIKAVFKDGRLTYEEIHRFTNVPVERDGTLCWNFEELLGEVHTGINKAGSFDSIGFDTWGVDFALLDKDGWLLESPVHYRDGRTNGMAKKAQDVLDPDTLYEQTGNQIMDINTLYQLLALREQHPSLYAKAGKLLFLPDLFAYSLGADPVCEYTICSTSQMFNIASRGWSGKVLDAFGIPAGLFPPFVHCGTVTGRYRNAKIIAVAGHDTQCAAAALLCTEEESSRSVFLSCGTWSLIGTELDEPVLSPESRQAGLSNELGANGKVNYLKNIIGLWLIQESRREWRRQGKDYSFNDLERFASEAQPRRSFIDPDDPVFVPAGNIPERIAAYCRRTGQPAPLTPGETMRCIYESLALKYRFAVKQLAEATGKEFAQIHILGGGARDETLCRMTADCCGLPVTAGPVEATALGNILTQLVALGDIQSIAAGRKLLMETERLRTYEPENSADWNGSFAAFTTLLSSKHT